MSSAVIENYIAGNFLSSEKLFTNTNPVHGSVVAMVAEADRKMVDNAVRAGRETSDGEWGAYSPEDRARLLHSVAAGIEKRFDEFVDAEAADTGKPDSRARTLDIPSVAVNFRFFANLDISSRPEASEMGTADGGGALNYSVRKPLGVVGVISPWDRLGGNALNFLGAENQ